MQKIYNFEIDIGVIAEPNSIPFREDIYSIPYLKQKIIIIVGKNHKLSNKNNISIRELNGLTFINREKGSHRDIVVINAGAGIKVGGKAESLAEGIKLAEESIDSGSAKNVLQSLAAVK